MRPQSRQKIRVKGKVIGGPFPLICLPLVAADLTSLLNQAQEVKAFQPDLILVNRAVETLRLYWEALLNPLLYAIPLDPEQKGYLCLNILLRIHQGRCSSSLCLSQAKIS